MNQFRQDISNLPSAAIGRAPRREDRQIVRSAVGEHPNWAVIVEASDGVVCGAGGEFNGRLRTTMTTVAKKARVADKRPASLEQVIVDRGAGVRAWNRNDVRAGIKPIPRDIERNGAIIADFFPAYGDDDLVEVDIVWCPTHFERHRLAVIVRFARYRFPLYRVRARLRKRNVVAATRRRGYNSRASHSI